MRLLVLTSAMVTAILSFPCAAATEAPFNPDSDPSRVRWSQLEKVYGPTPDAKGQRFGVILKTLTNEYWRLMAAGYRHAAVAADVKLDIQAARNEADQLRQLSFMQNMIGSHYRAILISPISAINLQPAIDEAASAGLTVVDVDGAVVDSIRNFVGPVNRDMGVLVANWFIRQGPKGGKVAIIEGQAGVFSTVQRTRGFREAILAGGIFEIVASVSAHWDRQQSFDATKAIIETTPDLVGIYCNNDTMALGAVDALKEMHRLSNVKVFGSDGTSEAIASIAAGELTGTVDIFPMVIASLGLDVAERLSNHQVVARVVETPQILVTRDNFARYGAGYDATLKALLDDERE